MKVLFIDVYLSIEGFVPITNYIILNTEANIVVVLHGYLKTLFALRFCCFSFVFLCKKIEKNVFAYSDNSSSTKETVQHMKVRPNRKHKGTL